MILVGGRVDLTAWRLTVAVCPLRALQGLLVVSAGSGWRQYARCELGFSGVATEEL